MLLLIVAVLAVAMGAVLLNVDAISASVRLAWMFEVIGVNEWGYMEYRHRKAGITFVKLPGGAMLMGSPESEEGHLEDQRQHWVTLSPFLIAKYELSQSEWIRVMGPNPSHFKGEDLPVENVSWADCNAFCERVGLALPTEVQWEYACRAGANTPFSFGVSITTDQANFNGIKGYGGGPEGESRERTMPVGSFVPNAFGLHQMHGNVWEWCVDWYDSAFYTAWETVPKDPICTNDGSGVRVVRGGSWQSLAEICRSAFRNGRWPPDRDRSVGFRPAFRLR